MSKNINSASLTKTKKINWKKVLSTAVLFLSLFWLGYKVYESWDTLVAYDLQIKYKGLLPSFGLYIFQFVLIIWVWKSIMNSLAHPLDFIQHVKIYGYTNLIRRIPAGFFFLMAGRAYAYKDKDIPARTSTIGSFLEFFFVLLTGLPLVSISAAFLGYLSKNIAFPLAIIIFILELYVIRPSTLCKILIYFKQQPFQSNLSHRTTLFWFGMYTIIWLVSGIGLFIIIQLFQNLPISSLPIVISTWILSSLISYITLFSPSGFGVKELSLTLLLGLFLSEPLPLITALAIRVVWTIYDMLIGVAVQVL